LDLGIAGKTALVFGAAGGLGGAIARALAAEGARVAVSDINEDALSQTVADIRAAGAEALPLQWDLSDLSVVESRIQAIHDAFGGVDILVSNTGGPPPTPAAGQSVDLWTRSFQSMVLSVIAITDQVLPGMRERKWGALAAQRDRLARSVKQRIAQLFLESPDLRADSGLSQSKPVARRRERFGFSSHDKGTEIANHI